MAKQLAEDQIKWILSLNASDAEKSLNKLSQESLTCKNRNKDLREELKKLEIMGKQDSQQFKDLSAEYTKNSAKIKENEALTKKLNSTMGVEKMSMSQLKSYARDLQKQMDNTSQALHPTEYATLDKNLKTVKTRMGELTTAGSKVRNEFEGIIKSANKWNVIGNMLGNAAMNTFRSLWSEMKSFVSESTGLAASTDGIRKAFNRIDQPGLLSELRKSVKGTLSDVQLMQRANLANTFKIPVQYLSKFFEFAHLRANQTGKDVQELSTNVVEAVGKMTPKKIVSLGLNPNDVKAKIKETGNVLTAMYELFDEQIKTAGGNYASAMDGAKKRAADLANEQEKLGEQLVPIKMKWMQLYNQVKIYFAQSIVWIAQHKTTLLGWAKIITGIGVIISAFNTIMKVSRMVKLADATATDILTGSTRYAKIATQDFTKATAESNIITKIFTGTFLLLKAAFLLCTGQLTKAKEAMAAFNLVSGVNPYVILGTAIAAVIAYFVIFRRKVDEVSQTLKSIGNVNKKVAEAFDEERAKITLLSQTVHNSNLPYQERLTALRQLQKIVPDYHASLTKEGKLINDNAVALDNYLKKKKQEIIIDAAKDELTALYKQLFETQRQITLKNKMIEIRDKKAAKEDKNPGYIVSPTGGVIQTVNVSREISKGYREENDVNKTKLSQINAAISALTNIMNNALISVNKMTITPNVSSFDTANKPKKQKKPKVDKNAAALTNQQAAHDQEINDIKANDIKKEQLEEQTNIDIAQSDIAYYNKRISLLDSFISKEKNVQKKSVYQKGISEAKEKQAEAEQTIDKNKIAILQKYRDEDLTNQDNHYKMQQAYLEEELALRKITQEDFDAAMLNLNIANNDNKLLIEKNYLDEVNKLDLKNKKLKEDAAEKANQDKIQAELAAVKARAEQAEKVKNLINNMQSKEPSPDEDYKLQKSVLDATYQGGKQQVSDYNKNAEQTGGEKVDRTLLDKAYNSASEKLALDHEQKIMQIRQQFGIDEHRRQLDLQLADIKKAEDQGVISHKEAEAQKLAATASSYKQQADYYGSLFSNAVQSMQQAEADQVDAKYDAEIEAAKGNSTETTRLENEKEKKKLEIQKKYADVNFAIKVSTIISDTAVSIMKAYAELGPIAGSVAAALMGVTGAMQIKSAKAERDKVKRMTVGSDSSTSTVTRVATGRESGGSIQVERAQDGKLFDASYDPDKRGYVDKPTVIVGEGKDSLEWVASNAAVNNPTIAPYLNIIDKAQQAGTIKSLDLNKVIKARSMAGYATGGYINNSNNNSSPVTSQGIDVDVDKLNKAIENLQNGVPAYVVLSDLERQQQIRDNARKIGSRS